MPDTYEVEQGDSIPSIALETGFFWQTLWNDPNNADLKNKRKNPNVLYPGDQVYIPDIKTKTETRPAEKRHKFVRKGDPVKIVILLKNGGKARANEAYTLEVDGKTYKGNTDGDGKVTQKITGNAAFGTLSLKDGKEVYRVLIGHLDPVDTISGVQQRLLNIGFVCPESGELDDDTQRALLQFQAKHDLPMSGELDEATKNKLADLSQ